MKKILTLLLLIVLTASVFAMLVSCDDVPEEPTEPENYEAFIKDNLSEIKNVILFIGDGMGFNHIANAQKYFENANVFDYAQNLAGTVTTYSLDSDVTDSAAAGTALATGNKVQNGKIAKLDGKDLTSIMSIAQEKGKRTGIITTEYLSGATPAAFSSHAYQRANYSTIVQKQAESGINLLVGDYDKNEYYKNNKDKFTQNGYLMTDSFETLLATQKNQKVIANVSGLRSKYNENITDNTIDLDALLNYSFDYLDNQNGFFLMVEGAYIDKCSHNNDLVDALCEVRSLSEMIGCALEFAANRNDTVIIVTADHESGGLALADTKEAITNSLYSKTNHTGANVPLYIFGYDMGKDKTFDNTDIFKLCKVLVSHNNGKMD